MTRVNEFELYRGFLNELPPVKIGGYEYLQGDALKVVDPIAFRVGAADYADALAQGGELEQGPDGEYYAKE
jgi:hypothetical protein